MSGTNGWAGLEKRISQRLDDREPAKGPPELRPAAVLVPIIGVGHSRRLLLTRRADNLRRQPGDIAFPGGAVEPGDASALDTALRESREEIGLQPGDVSVLGQMDERGTVTGFRITPFVGAISGPYVFRPNHEVADILVVPLDALADPHALRVEKRRFPDGAERDVYHYRYQQHDIWGITGRLVRDFLALIR